jgi:hypothetical protein
MFVYSESLRCYQRDPTRSTLQGNLLARRTLNTVPSSDSLECLSVCIILELGDIFLLYWKSGASVLHAPIGF